MSNFKTNHGKALYLPAWTVKPASVLLTANNATMQRVLLFSARDCGIVWSSGRVPVPAKSYSSPPSITLHCYALGLTAREFHDFIREKFWLISLNFCLFLFSLSFYHFLNLTLTCLNICDRWRFCYVLQVRIIMKMHKIMIIFKQNCRWWDRR